MSLTAHFVNVRKIYFIVSNFILEKVTVSGEGMDMKGLLDVTTEM